MTEYETEEAKAATGHTGYTVKPCGAPLAELAAVTGPLWIQCTTGSQTFSASSSTTLQSSKVFFDAKSVNGQTCSPERHTRLHPRRHGQQRHSPDVASGSFKMDRERDRRVPGHDDHVDRATGSSGHRWWFHLLHSTATCRCAAPPPSCEEVSPGVACP